LLNNDKPPFVAVSVFAAVVPAAVFAVVSFLAAALALADTILFTAARVK